MFILSQDMEVVVSRFVVKNSAKSSKFRYFDFLK